MNTNQPSTIPYLEHGIKSIGTLDPTWAKISEKTLILAHGSTELSKIQVTFRLAYSAEKLFILIAAKTTSLKSRNRGYQNGDGFHMVLGRPKKADDQFIPTDEFYVLGFWYSPTQKNIQNASQTIWYYNRDLLFRKLPETDVTIFSKDDFSYFQVAIPWTDVPPYKPYLNDDVGINLCYVQAVGDEGKNYYYLLPDERIQRESSDRMYARFEFERKSNLETQHVSVDVTEHLIMNDRSTSIRIASNTSHTAEVKITITAMRTIERILNLPQGITVQDIPIPTDSLKFGLSEVKVFLDGVNTTLRSTTTFPILRLDATQIAAFDRDISQFRLDPKIKRGDINSFEFHTNELRNQIKRFKIYESPRELAKTLGQVDRLSHELKTDKQIMRDRATTIYRRAFYSSQDNTLQPYSLRTPRRFDGNPHSLIVLLHGSGEDDRWLFHTMGEIYDLADKFNAFILTPKGRGVSDCYTANGSHHDVIEAITDVKKQFNIDSQKVLLAGFSMGGYGVYRIGSEFSNQFSGFLVLSGTPSVGRQWHGSDHPDFLEDSSMATLPKKPFFILHSRDDLNCPFKDTITFAERLKTRNHEARFHISENSGHSGPSHGDLCEIDEWISEKDLL